MDRKTISKQLEEKRYSEDFIPVLGKKERKNCSFLNFNHF